MVLPQGILKTFPIDGMGAGAFCWGQHEPNRSNEVVTLAITAVALKPGTVLGKITATGLYKPLDPAASDGSQNFAGILWDYADISTVATPKTVILARSQIVNANLLTYVNSVSAAQRTAVEAAMEAKGIIARY